MSNSSPTRSGLHSVFVIKAVGPVYALGGLIHESVLWFFHSPIPRKNVPPESNCNCKFVIPFTSKKKDNINRMPPIYVKTLYHLSSLRFEKKFSTFMINDLHFRIDHNRYINDHGQYTTQ